MNEGQEAFRRFTRQLRVGGASNGRFPGGGGGLFAGSGLLIALAAGGFALNAALFNGERLPSLSGKWSNFSSVDGGHRAIKYSRCVLRIIWQTGFTNCISKITRFKAGGLQ